MSAFAEALARHNEAQGHLATYLQRVQLFLGEALHVGREEVEVRLLANGTVLATLPGSTHVSVPSAVVESGAFSPWWAGLQAGRRAREQQHAALQVRLAKEQVRSAERELARTQRCVEDLEAAYLSRFGEAP